MKCISAVSVRRFYWLLSLGLLVSGCVSTSSPELTHAPVSESTLPVVSEQVALPSNPYLDSRKAFSINDKVRFDDALTYISQNDYEQAKHALEGIDESPETPSAYWIIKGDIAKANGNLDDAIHDYETALSHNEHNYFAMNRLAVVARESGDFERAKQLWEHALAVWPDNQTVQLNLAILFDLYLGDKTSALSHYNYYQTLLQQANKPEDKKTLGRVARWISDLERQQTAVANKGE